MEERNVSLDANVKVDLDAEIFIMDQILEFEPGLEYRMTASLDPSRMMDPLKTAAEHLAAGESIIQVDMELGVTYTFTRIKD